MDTPALECISLSKVFGATWAVRELSLAVPRGTLYGIASTTGSGTQGLIGGLIAFAVPALCLVPVVIAGLLLPATTLAEVLLLVLSLLWAVGLLTAGVVLGGGRLDARAPEMLEQLRRAEI